MPRSEEAEHWFNAVYAAIQQIPRGKVTTYGHVAYLLDERVSPLSYICTCYLPVIYLPYVL